MSDDPRSLSMTLEDVRDLAQLMRECDLVELELSSASGERLRLRRGAAEAPLPRVSVPAAAPPPAPAEEARPDVSYVTSPFVGTFYRAPGPEAQAYVQTGQRVRKGQPLCIIEAMKLMNELEAEFDCVIVECLAQNGRSVEYGERLFAVRPA